MSNPLTATATRLRLTLIVAIVLVVAIVVGVVVYGVKFLNAYADEVHEQVVATSTSTASLENIRLLSQRLEANQPAVERAQQIVAESQEYQYQDTIIQDIESFADRADIEVVSYDFAAADAAAPAPTAATPPPTAAEPSATPDAAAVAPPASPSTLTSQVVTVSLATPVNYRNFLNFLNYIEQNLTKMQVAKVDLARGENASSITTNSLEIEVYVR